MCVYTGIYVYTRTTSFLSRALCFSQDPARIPWISPWYPRLGGHKWQFWTLKLRFESVLSTCLWCDTFCYVFVRVEAASKVTPDALDCGIRILLLQRVAWRLSWTILSCILPERNPFWSASGPPLGSPKLRGRVGRPCESDHKAHGPSSLPIHPLYISNIFVCTWNNI